MKKRFTEEQIIGILKDGLAIFVSRSITSGQVRSVLEDLRENH